MSHLRFVTLLGAVLLTVVAVMLGSERRSAAETEGSVAIACDLLASAIDGDTSDAIVPADTTDACDGIDASDVAALSDALGDQDSTLEASDFAAIDTDGNLLQLGGSIELFAFVDNDGTVVFDAEIGLSIAVHSDGTGGELQPADDANAETCDGPDDLDCGTTTLSNGDGVVVARASTNGSADVGDRNDVDMFQVDDTGQVNTQTVHVFGASNAESLALTATPAEIACDGSEYSTVTATAFDQDGNRVADGTSVTFAVVGIGLAFRPVETTVDGVASSLITPTDPTQVSVTVIVVSGDAQASIRIDCEAPRPPCPDFDGDGRVTGRDVAAVARARRTQDLAFDMDGDGLVTVADQHAVVRQTGTVCPMSPPLR